MSPLARLSSIVRRPAAALSARLGRGVPDAGGWASPDDLSAYDAEMRRAFLEPTDLEPAVWRRRPTPTTGEAPGQAPDGPVAEPGAWEPRPVPVVSPPEPAAPVVDAVRAAAPATRPELPTPISPAPARPAVAPPAVPRASRSDAGPGGSAAVGSPATEMDRAALESETTAPRARASLLVAAAVVAVAVVTMAGGGLIVGAVISQAPDELGAPPASAPPVTAVPAATLPAGVAAGLLEVAAVNERLARAVADLDVALQVRRPAASVIGPLLRAIASDARSGRAAVDRVTAWPAAGAYPAETAAFYEAVALVAADGLGAALGDDAAYAESGRRMLEALASLPEISAATRASAGRAGVPLPMPASTPAATPTTGG